MMAALLALVAAGVSACSPEPEYGLDGVCHYGGSSPLARELRSDIPTKSLQWTPDGSQILFGYREFFLQAPLHVPIVYDVPDIYAVDVSGDPVEEVLDLPSRSLALEIGGLRPMFDLSPDGARIAYVLCAVSEELLQRDGQEWRVYSPEIFLSDINDKTEKRLTNNTYFDVLPAWSPDGKRLAFISDPDRSVDIFEKNPAESGHSRIYAATTRLRVHEIATDESREIGLPTGLAVAPVRLEWSPSGDRIAFVVLEGEKSPWNLAVYTVGADGTGLTRVSDAVSGPAWAPDGQSIAMIVDEGDDEWTLYVFAADGSNVVREKHELGDISSVYFEANPWGWVSYSGSKYWYGNLSWSPRGSAILLERLTDPEPRPAVVPLGTAGVGAGASGASEARTGVKATMAGAGSILASPLISIPPRYYLAAWSPDGTQIAMRTDIGQFLDLEVIDLKGNSRVVLDWDRYGDR